MIRWIQLKQPLNIPGPGTASKWHSSSAPGLYKGMVSSIVRDDCGYWLHLPSGQNAGWYHIPFEFVQCAFGDPPESVTGIAPVVAPDVVAKRGPGRPPKVVA